MSVYIPTIGQNVLNVPELVSAFDLNTRNQYYSTIFGLDAGTANQGIYNTLIGYKAGNRMMYGINNVFVGANAGMKTLGTDNIFIGTNAGASVLSYSRNICVGTTTGREIQGNNNIFIGHQNTSGYSTCEVNIGVGVGQSTNGNRNISMGYQNTVNADNNVLLGANIISQGNNSILVGTQVTNVASNVLIINSTTSNIVAFNSNNNYTNINNILENKLLDAIGTTSTQVNGDVINLQGSNVNIYGNIIIKSLLNAPSALFSDTVKFLKGVNFSYSNLDNVHWQMGLDTKNARMSDLIFKSRNNTIVTFTDDFQSELLNFTGKHRCSPYTEGGVDLIHEKYIGRIVSSVGQYQDLDGKHVITMDEALPFVHLSESRNDPRVFGVISGRENPGPERTFKIGNLRFHTRKHSPATHKIVVNSHGEGAIWVCNIGGILKNGDLISSSGIKGYGMRQGDDICRSYTVAKITCDCTFSIRSSVYECRYFKWKGKLYKKALVGCVYKI